MYLNESRPGIKISFRIQDYGVATGILSTYMWPVQQYIFRKLTTTFGPALLAVTESFSIKRG